jgi:hypothetical protein
MMKKFTSCLYLWLLLATIPYSLSACGPIVNLPKPQATVTVSQYLQQPLTPIPTIPPYRCGAWTSTNIPATYSTIRIYARLTRESTTGLSEISAHAIAHFKSGDVLLQDQPISDINGYVTFNLSLQGQQPSLVPTTVDVTFDTPNQPTTCSAFFTPQ